MHTEKFVVSRFFSCKCGYQIMMLPFLFWFSALSNKTIVVSITSVVRLISPWLRTWNLIGINHWSAISWTTIELCRYGVVMQLKNLYLRAAWKYSSSLTQTPSMCSISTLNCISEYVLSTRVWRCNSTSRISSRALVVGGASIVHMLFLLRHLYQVLGNHCRRQVVLSRYTVTDHSIANTTQLRIK